MYRYKYILKCVTEEICCAIVSLASADVPSCFFYSVWRMPVRLSRPLRFFRELLVRTIAEPNRVQHEKGHSDCLQIAYPVSLKYCVLWTTKTVRIVFIN